MLFARLWVEASTSLLRRPISSDMVYDGKPRVVITIHQERYSATNLFLTTIGPKRAGF
jgi:hypothetical protein